MPRQPITIYRVIRIDAQYDPNKLEQKEAIEHAVQKAVSDALAHKHTIENGIEVTDITDCGESV